MPWLARNYFVIQGSQDTERNPLNHAISRGCGAVLITIHKIVQKWEATVNVAKAIRRPCFAHLGFEQLLHFHMHVCLGLTVKQMYCLFVFGS